MSEERPTLIVGYAAAWRRQAVGRAPAVFVEEPEVAARLAADGTVPESRLIGFDYLQDDAVARFRAARPGFAPTAVIPGVEYAVPFAAGLAETCGVPGAGHGAASVLRDKWLLRQAMERGPVANPGSWPVTGPEELRELMAAHGAPLILKPANHQGSIGTQIVREPADVEAAWTACVVEDQISGMPDMVLPIRMLAEQFVEGPEYSVEALVRDGDVQFANVTRKYLYPGARPVEQGHVVPADLPAGLRGRLIDDTRLVLATTGFRTGFAHCEWIVRDGVPYLMECAGRIPGDWIVGLIDLAWGMDTMREYLAVMRGEAPSRLPSAPLGGSAVWFLDAPAGRIRSVGGVAEARAAPGVLVVETLAKVGDTARPPRSGRDRTGFVVAAAPSGAEALRLARQASRLIRFATAEHEPILRHGGSGPSAEPVP